LIVFGLATDLWAQTRNSIVNIFGSKLYVFEYADQSGKYWTFDADALSGSIPIQAKSAYNTVKVEIDGRVGWVPLAHVELEHKRTTADPCEGRTASGGQRSAAGMRGVGGQGECR
jgi:hypothetical protein